MSLKNGFFEYQRPDVLAVYLAESWNHLTLPSLNKWKQGVNLDFLFYVAYSDINGKLAPAVFVSHDEL